MDLFGIIPSLIFALLLLSKWLEITLALTAKVLQCCTQLGFCRFQLHRQTRVSNVHECPSTVHTVHQLKKTTYIPMTSNNINSNTIHNTTWCRFDQSPLTSPGADLTLQLLHSFCKLICSGIHWFGHHLGGITLWSLKVHRICVKSLPASHILLRIFQFLYIPQNSNKACQDVKSDSNQSKNCHCQSTGDDTTRPGAGPFQSDPHLVLSSVRWKSKKKWLNGW